MKFAKFWEKVEVSVDADYFGRSALSIWGASNESPEDARNGAQLRASKFKNLLSKKTINLADYEYGTGYIREEIVEEVVSSHGRNIAVLTRNGYGALVINSESVFFGDIDVPEAGFIARLLEKFGKAKQDKTYFVAKVEAFQKNNPKYTMMVYETFAGLRVVITNELFDSKSSQTDEIFTALDTDPLYMLLCKNQGCFRARLSPKPWRMGLKRPKTKFPRQLKQDQDDFKQWLVSYERAAKAFGTVKRIETFGSARTHEDVARVLSMHDRYATSQNVKLA